MSETIYKGAIEIDISKARSSLTTLISQINDLISLAKTSGMTFVDEFEDIEDTLQNVTESIQESNDALDGFGAKGQQAGERIAAAQNKLQKEVKQTHDETRQLSEEMERSGEKGSNAFNGIRNALSTIQLTSIIQQVQMVAQALGELSAPGIAFEQSMADLAAITGVAGEELEELKQAAREVGRESGLGAAESARAFAILAGQIDVPIDKLRKLQRETITLAQAGNISLEEAANAVAGTINQFQMSADESTRVVNVLAAAARAGGAEVVDLAESMRVSGAAANAAGVSIEETAAALEVLAQNNTKGAEAGTALRNALIAMQTRLQIDVSQTGFVGGLERIKTHVESLNSEVEKATFLSKTFGRENVVAAQYLLANTDAVRAMTKEVTGTNSAIEQANIRTNTWAERMKRVKASVDDFLISIQEATGGMLPWLAIIGQQMAQFSMMLPLFDRVKAGIGSLVGKIGMVTSAQWSWNAALAANPIGLIVVAVAAFAAAVVYAYRNFEGFRSEVDRTFAALKDLGKIIWDTLKPAWDDMLPILKKVGEYYLTWVLMPLRTVMGIIREVVGWVKALKEQWDSLPEPIRKVGELFLMGLHPITSFIRGVKLLKEAFQALKNTFTQVAQRIQEALHYLINKFRDFIGELMRTDGVIGKLLTPIKALILTFHSLIYALRSLVGKWREAMREAGNLRNSLEKIKVVLETIVNPLAILKHGFVALGDAKKDADTKMRDNSGMDAATRSINENAEALRKHADAVLAHALAQEQAKQLSGYFSNMQAGNIPQAMQQLGAAQNIPNLVQQVMHNTPTPLIPGATYGEENPLRKTPTAIVENTWGGINNGDDRPRNMITLEGMRNILSDLETKAAGATFDVAAALQKQIDELKKKIKLEEDVITAVSKNGNWISGLARDVLGGNDEDAKNRFRAEWIEKSNFDLRTQEGIQNEINLLQQSLNRATGDRAVTLQRQIIYLQQEADILRETLALEAKYGKGASLIGGAILRHGSKEEKENFNRSKENRFSPNALSKESIQNMASGVQKGFEKAIKRQQNGFKKAREEYNKYVKEIQDGAGGIADVMNALSNRLDDQKKAWLQWGANLLKVLSDSIPKLLQFWKTNIAVTASEAAKSQAGIPVVGPGLALAAAASIASSLIAMPFANGGIVSGPTYALVGEYPGAANNPEVIAPLNKLRDMLPSGGNDGAGGGNVEFKIRGRDLIGLINKEGNINKRS